MNQPAIQTGAKPGQQLIAYLNRIIHAYGESIRSFFREQQRSSLISPLFNIPGRMILGGYCYFESLPQLLKTVIASDSPETIGQRMRRFCSLPNYISLNSLMIGYLNGREQARLRGTFRGDDLEDIATVLDFWARAASAYRSDGLWLPDQSSFDVPILSLEQIQAVAQRLRPKTHERSHLRRMLATLELYTFILNGEARIGVFHHGPYALDDREVMVVKEYVGLQESYYPWATAGHRLPFPTIARVMRLRDVHAKIVLMGSMTTEPRSYEQSVLADGIFIGLNGELAELPEDDFPKVAEAAGQAQLDLYRQMSEWDERYRVEYGGELYGCILSAFAPSGRQDEFRRAIRTAFRQTTERHLDDLASGTEPALVLQHIATTDGPIYAPIAA